MTKGTNYMAKRAFKIISDAVLIIILIVSLFVLAITITSKKDSDGTATIFGIQLRFVQSDSMEKCEYTDVDEYEIKSIPVKSCVFVQVAPSDEEARNEWYKNLRIGDVLTFKYVYTKQETITHRIINIEDNHIGGYLITLMGDNKNSDSDLLIQTINTSLEDSPNYIIGKVIGQSYVLGLLVYAYKTPVGIIFLIIIPCLIVMAFEIIKLVKVLNEDKKSITQRQADEIEELKKQLARLQESENQKKNSKE